MEILRNFIGSEVACQKRRLLLSKRKYILDLLERTGFLGCKPSSIPIESDLDA